MKKKLEIRQVLLKQVKLYLTNISQLIRIHNLHKSRILNSYGVIVSYDNLIIQSFLSMNCNMYNIFEVFHVFTSFCSSPLDVGHCPSFVKARTSLPRSVCAKVLLKFVQHRALEKLQI